jgi:hypothetical protein
MRWLKGANSEKMIEFYPSLKVNDIRAAVAYAAASLGKIFGRLRPRENQIDENVSRHLQAPLLRFGHDVPTAITALCARQTLFERILVDG